MIPNTFIFAWYCSRKLFTSSFVAAIISLPIKSVTKIAPIQQISNFIVVFNVFLQTNRIVECIFMMICLIRMLQCHIQVPVKLQKNLHQGLDADFSVSYESFSLFYPFVTFLRVINLIDSLIDQQISHYSL